MSSIPLVALNVRPVEQPDVAANYGRLLQLKGIQQEQQQRAAAAPFQQQQLEQQTQAGAIQLQQAQQAQKDQQAFRSAMQDPTMQGKTLGDVADTLAHQGAISPAAWQAAKKADIEQRKTLLDMNSAQFDNASKALTANKQLFESVMSLPDEQVTQNWPQIVQQYNSIPGNEKRPLNPQQPLTKDQIAQQGPMLALHQAYMDDSLARREKQTAADTADATLKKTQAEASFYQQTGTVPGVSAELQQQADWLKKNPGKGPSDFLLWKQRNSPSAVVMNSNLLAGAQNSQGLDFAAQNYRQTGQMPAGYTRSPQTTSAIIARAAQLDAEEGGQGIAANKSLLTANRTSLNNLQKNFDQVSAFEGTANKNLDLYLEKLGQIPDLGAKFANVPMRMINDKMIGTANYQAMKAAQQTAAAETAKVLSSANASGVLSDSQKKEAEDILSGNLSYAAAQKVVATLKQDFANRHQSYQAQIGDIQSRVKNTGVSNAAPGQPSGGSSDNFFTQHGGVSH